MDAKILRPYQFAGNQRGGPSGSVLTPQSGVAPGAIRRGVLLGLGDGGGGAVAGGDVLWRHDFYTGAGKFFLDVLMQVGGDLA